MANTAISKINVEDNGTTTQYLIEPTLYASATLESGKTSDYVATLNNFELFDGVAVNVKFTADVPANAQLNINETGAKNITYAGNNIKANVLLEDHIYTLVYKDTWQVINEVSSGTYLPLTGGTVTGDVIMTDTDPASAGDTYKYAVLRRKVTAKKTGTGGWARVGLSFIDNNDNEFAKIGVYGTSETFNYLYIGTGAYNDNNNIRIDGSGNITQSTGYIHGQTPTTSYPRLHSIKLGHQSDDKMNFYEYGGVFNWYKNNGTTDTLLMNLNGNTLTVANLAGNASSASQVSASLATTTKTFLLGTSTTLTSSAANVSLIGDTGVYLTATAGALSAVNYSWNVGGTEKAHTIYNSTDDTIDFVFD